MYTALDLVAMGAPRHIFLSTDDEAVIARVEMGELTEAYGLTFFYLR